MYKTDWTVLLLYQATRNNKKQQTMETTNNGNNKHWKQQTMEITNEGNNLARPLSLIRGSEHTSLAQFVIVLMTPLLSYCIREATDWSE